MRPRKTLHVASTPDVGQALDAGGILTGEAAGSPKRQSSKEPIAEAILQSFFDATCVRLRVLNAERVGAALARA
jgi:hypothetical protein